MDNQTVSLDELHIRAATTLLRALSPKVELATKSDKNAALSVATHIAILLSRGVDVQAKGKFGVMVRPVAVATSTIAPRWEVLATSSATVAAHPGPHSDYRKPGSGRTARYELVLGDGSENNSRRTIPGVSRLLKSWFWGQHLTNHLQKAQIVTLTWHWRSTQGIS